MELQVRLSWSATGIGSSIMEGCGYMPRVYRIQRRHCPRSTLRGCWMAHLRPYLWQHLADMQVPSHVCDRVLLTHAIKFHNTRTDVTVILTTPYYTATTTVYGIGVTTSRSRNGSSRGKLGPSRHAILPQHASASSTSPTSIF